VSKCGVEELEEDDEDASEEIVVVEIVGRGAAVEAGDADISVLPRF